MRRRRLLRGLILLVLLLGVALTVWWVSGGPERRLIARLERGLEREVTVDDVAIAWRHGELLVHGLTIAAPPGTAAPPPVTLDTAALDLSPWALLRGRLAGDVRLLGLEIHADPDTFPRTWIPGVLRPTPDLALHLTSTRVHLPRDLGPLEHLEAHAHLTRHRLQVHRAQASLHGGRLLAHGLLEHAPAARWSLHLEGADIPLRAELAPLAARVYPPLAGWAPAQGAAVHAAFGFTLDAAAPGLHREALVRGLEGGGTFAISRLRLTDASLGGLLLGLVDARLGDGIDGSARFSFRDGWVELVDLRMEDRAVQIPLRGRVALDGRLDLVVDLMPLTHLMGTVARYAIQSYTKQIPLRIGGTVSAPRLEPPTSEDLGTHLLGPALRDLLAR